MAVRSGCVVDRLAQTKRTDDALWREFKLALHFFGEPLVRHHACALGIHQDTRGLGDANGVTQLHFADIRKLCCNDVLGDVARHVCSTAIDLRWILAAECAAAVTTATTVGVHDDLASSEAAIAVRSADFKLTSWVDVDGDLIVPPLAKHWLDDVLDDFCLELLLPGHAVPHWIMLRGKHHSVDACGLETHIRHSDLTLGIGAKTLDDVLLTHHRLALD